MDKVSLLEYLDDPVVIPGLNRMGCSENWYNPYYAVMETFSREEIEAMSAHEVSNLLKLASKISEYLY